MTTAVTTLLAALAMGAAGLVIMHVMGAALESERIGNYGPALVAGAALVIIVLFALAAAGRIR